MSAEDRVSRIAAVGYDYGAQEKELVGSCNLCASTRLIEAARRDRYGFPATMRICADCGLGFLSPRLTPAGYSDFYAGTYRPLVSAYHGRLIDATTVQADQRGYAKELTAFLADSLQADPASLLDVGGSTGIVAGVVGSAFGSTMSVLDPSPDELAVADAAGMETFAGLAEEFDPGDRRWDLILLCQTIDHLLDVKATLRAMRAMLSPEGHAFVDVLDIGFAIERHGLEGSVKIDHPFYLDRETAIAYLTQAGFAVVAERLSDDGHWGFLVRGDRSGELDPGAMRSHADRILARIWELRARESR